MTYGHHVKANYAPNREFCNFPPFLIVVLQHRHQIQNLCKILIYLKKKDHQKQTVFIVFTALYVWKSCQRTVFGRNFLSLAVCLRVKI